MAAVGDSSDGESADDEEEWEGCFGRKTMKIFSSSIPPIFSTTLATSDDSEAIPDLLSVSDSSDDECDDVPSLVSVSQTLLTLRTTYTPIIGAQKRLRP
jgi:hypothetical protein